MSKEKSFSSIGNSFFFFFFSGQVVVAIVTAINTVITGVRLQQTVRLQLNRMISEE